MNIKSIINNSVASISNCDQEPIHIPGSIQPYGCLLAVQADTLLIDFCSENVADFVDINYQECLNRPVAEVLGTDLETLLRNMQGQPQNIVIAPVAVTINSRELLCTLHWSGSLLVVELEPAENSKTEVAFIFGQMVQFVNSTLEATSMKELCSKVAVQTRAITGYDRVMVYRFDKDNNGEVYAESKVDGIEPFLGLHYPHTDIPAQARKLYLTNMMRMITDVHYQPVPIYTLKHASADDLDMSKTILRSVSPIHIKYLQNMGVSATLTISLIHNNALWGLITCHHYSPKYLPSYTRLAAQMQGHFLTSQLNIRQQSEDYNASIQINRALERLLDNVYEPSSSSFRKIAEDEHLRAICNAGGVAIIFDGITYIGGEVPPQEEIVKLAKWLQEQNKHGIFHTSELSVVYPEGKAFATTGAGVIFHSLNGMKNDCIIWFAPELQEEVHWAGNPNDAMTNAIKSLTPRNSFELWKEVTMYKSRPWLNPELLAATSYVHALQKHKSLILISEEEKKHRLLTLKLQEVNTELENINWISSHDLREPLRKILVFSSKILDKEQVELSESVLLLINKMNRSANKMQQMISDITTYNKTRLAEGTLEAVDLNVLVKRVIEELSEDIAETNTQFNYAELPTVFGISFLLTQLFANLLRNSIKFAKDGEAPKVTIAYEGLSSMPGEHSHEAGYHKIVVRDNGIGFDNNYAEQIFKVFYRLEKPGQYDGSGIGLALCKKIMQNHGGGIFADGQRGVGASFVLYFPYGKPELPQ